MLDLGIVIVSWNVRDLLAACLESVVDRPQSRDGRPPTLDSLPGLAGGLRLQTEIVVVDNQSHDGSAEMVRTRFPQVRLVVSERNLGFAGGNNLGMRYWGLAASMPETHYPRYVLLLNPDTVVHGDALATLARFMEATPRAGMCGARLVYGDGSFQHSAFGFPGLWQIVLDRPGVHGRLSDSRLNGRYSRALYAAGRPFEIGHPLGAAFMARSDAIRQAGLMDDRFHMYCEEIDWAWRIHRAGWKAYCVPQAEIIHYGGQSTRQAGPEMIVALWTSRLQLYRKHQAGWKLTAARWLVRRKMLDEIRLAQARRARGEMDESTCNALTDAYRRVIELTA
jgi:N-acetylglucosaminyl-diphospho-decaprenol L-rhamnosyltransferase